MEDARQQIDMASQRLVYCAVLKFDIQETLQTASRELVAQAKHLQGQRSIIHRRCQGALHDLLRGLLCG